MKDISGYNNEAKWVFYLVQQVNQFRNVFILIIHFQEN